MISKGFEELPGLSMLRFNALVLNVIHTSILVLVVENRVFL